MPKRQVRATRKRYSGRGGDGTPRRSASTAKSRMVDAARALGAAKRHTDQVSQMMRETEQALVKDIVEQDPHYAEFAAEDEDLAQAHLDNMLFEDASYRKAKAQMHNAVQEEERLRQKYDNAMKMYERTKIAQTKRHRLELHHDLSKKIPAELARTIVESGMPIPTYRHAPENSVIARNFRRRIDGLSGRSDQTSPLEPSP